MTDFLTLAAAIAAKFGATLATHDDGGDAITDRDRAVIDLPAPRTGLRIVMRRGFGGESTRIRATMSQTSASRDGANWQETPAFHTLETAAAMSRGADVIARQIESKLFAPAVELLEAWHVKRAAMRDDSARLTAAVLRWRERFPTANIGKRDERATEAQFYLSTRGTDTAIVRGTIRSDGRLHVDYMTTPDEAAGVAIVAAVTGC